MALNERERTRGMIEVLCCCKPENVIGMLPEGAPLILRDTEYEDGTFAGHAYDSHGLSENAIRALPGFMEAGTKRKPHKTWRKK